MRSTPLKRPNVYQICTNTNIKHTLPLSPTKLHYYTTLPYHITLTHHRHTHTHRSLLPKPPNKTPHTQNTPAYREPLWYTTTPLLLRHGGGCARWEVHTKCVNVWAKCHADVLSNVHMRFNNTDTWIWINDDHIYIFFFLVQYGEYLLLSRQSTNFDTTCVLPLKT